MSSYRNQDKAHETIQSIASVVTAVPVDTIDSPASLRCKGSRALVLIRNRGVRDGS